MDPTEKPSTSNGDFGDFVSLSPHISEVDKAPSRQWLKDRTRLCFRPVWLLVLCLYYYFHFSVFNSTHQKLNFNGIFLVLSMKPNYKSYTWTLLSYDWQGKL